MVDRNNDADDSSSIFSSETTATLTASLTEALVTQKGGELYNALNENYPYPITGPGQMIERTLHAALIDLHGDFGVPSEVARLIVERLEVPGSAFLDVGCGSQALLAIDLCERFPESEGTGLDLVPLDRDFSPPNFISDTFDLEISFPFPADHFDFVHHKYWLGWYPNPYEHFVTEMARVLAPGGLYLGMEPELAMSCEDGTPFQDRCPAMAKIASIQEGLLKAPSGQLHTSAMGDILSASGLFHSVHNELRHANLGVRKGQEHLPSAAAARSTWEIYSVKMAAFQCELAGWSIGDSRALEKQAKEELESLKHDEPGKGVFASYWVIWGVRNDAATPSPPPHTPSTDVPRAPLE